MRLVFVLAFVAFFCGHVFAQQTAKYKVPETNDVVDSAAAACAAVVSHNLATGWRQVSCLVISDLPQQSAIARIVGVGPDGTPHDFQISIFKFYVNVASKIIAIDPGHGYACASKNMLPGAIGVKDFPANDPPPGYLKEDELTMAIALEFKRLAGPKYTVVLTKNSVDDCPKYEERGEVAIKAKANVFVSIHINARNRLHPSNPFGNGTSVLWNLKRQDAKILAELMAPSVSVSLGVNNRGAMVDNKIAVLKATVTPKMTAVLVEAARLSGDDETKLHTAESATKVAAGIKAALDTYFGY